MHHCLLDMEMGIFERSRVAGLQRWEILSGIFLATSTITVLQGTVCFISLEFLLGFHVQGSISNFILLCLVTALLNSAFGMKRNVP